MGAFANLLGIVRSFRMYYADRSQVGRMVAFYRQFVGPGDLCFDVGAHLGSRVAAWTRIGARVVAIEPQPTFAQLLRRMYGRRRDVTVVEAAVASTLGQRTLYISSRTPTVSTLSLAWAERMSETKPGFLATDWDRFVVVPVTTLDALIARHGVPVFCKIDVEGSDLAVLEGLSTPLRALSFEYIPPTWDLAAACVDRLLQLAAYEFNWSSGESMRFALPAWVGRDRLLEVLQTMSAEDLPGDVYARLPTSISSYSATTGI